MKILTSALFFFIIFTGLKSDAAVIYVTQSGANSMNGTSWLNAFPGTALQFAINSAMPGDQVWVASGIYLTTTTNNRNIAYSMRNNVTIFGSFAGTETSLSQRIFSCGPTSVLSGEIGMSGIFDNSYHVISNSNLNNTAVIDGFEIRGANDNRPATVTEGLGGGIYNNGAFSGSVCSPVIRNCLIRNNQAVFGAGIFNSGYLGGVSNPLIQNCIIADNNAIDGGGGIDNFGLAGNASPTLVNCLIYNNTANTAGGMYCWGGNPGGNSSPVILNCSFINNRALAGNAGGIIADNSDAAGGGNSGTSNPVVRNSIFRNNTASLSGPQFFNKGTGLFTATYSNVDMTNQNPPHIISGPGTGNINSDPLFLSLTDGNGADNCWMTSDDGLTLLPGSPSVNSGDNSGVSAPDLLLNPRIHQLIVDMGPYEFTSTTKILDLTMFIQGFYNSALNILLQDTVRIYLRGNSTPFPVLDSGKAYLNNIGNASVVFSNALNNTDYYLQAAHRNSVETWSSGIVQFSSGTLNYNFSDSITKAFGSNMLLSDNSPVRYSIFSGDVIRDGLVNLNDLTSIYNNSAGFQTGYVQSDITGDALVNLNDLTIAYNNSAAFVSRVIP